MPGPIKISTEGLSDDTLKELGLYKELTESAKAAQEANKAAMDGLLEYAGKAAGLGDLLKGLSGGPVTIALNLADVATKYVNDYCAAIDKASDDQDKLNLDQHAAAISKLAASWNEAVQARADFNAAMSTAGGQGDPTQKQIENAGQVASAEEEAARRTIAALGEIQEARLRASGGSPAAIAGVAASTQGQLDDRQIAADAAPVTALQDEQKTRTAQDGDLRAAARKAMDAADAKKKGVEDIQTKLAEAQAKAQPGGELDKAVDTANAQLTAARAMNDDTYLPGPVSFATHNAARDRAVAEAQGKLNSANFDRDSTRGQIDRLKKALPDAEFDADVASALADKKKTEAITNAGRLQDLPGEITQAQKVAAFKTEGDLTTKATHTVAADIQAGAHIVDARSLQAAKEQQQRSRDLAQQLSVASQQAAAAHSESLHMIKELLDQINQANATLKRQIQNAHFNSQ